MDDLRSSSLKIDQVEELIKEQKNKKFKNWYTPITISTSILIFIGATVICVLCCLSCCKSCRNLAFWIFDMCKPRQCLKDTKDKLCVNIFSNSTNSLIHLRSVGYIPKPENAEEIHILQTPNNETKDEDESYRGPCTRSRKNFG